MTKTQQKILARGKAKALDSLFVGENAPFGYLAVGYVSGTETGFEDPMDKSRDDSTGVINPNDIGFNELDSVQYNYNRVPLSLVDTADYTNIDYVPNTGKVTRTYEATLEPGNIEGTYINQIAVVNNESKNESSDEFYSATSFNSFYKNSQSSITFRISFTL